MRLGVLLAAVGLASGVGGAPAWADEPIVEVAPEDRPDAVPVADPAPGMSEAVRARIGAEYLSEDERRALRLHHGAWTPEDLADPALAARAAVVTGAWDHPFASADGADPVDVAAAAVGRGDAEGAVGLLGGMGTPRAHRVRGAALEMLGRFGDAASAYAAGVEAGGDEAESVRAAMALLRLAGPRALPGDAESINRGLLDRIAAARDANRMDWRARLVEAELLYARHNRAEAVAAAREALRLNPRSAGALRLVAEVALDGFDFATATDLAARIDDGARLGGDALPTAASAAVHARAALRRRDPEGALAALEPALARMPAQRELLALRAAGVAASYRGDEADALLEAFDALSPGSPVALMAVGRTLAEARQYGLADGYLSRAIERAPFWSHPRLERGLMLVQAGEDAAAMAELEAALALDPFDLRAQNSLTLVRELATYETIETEHFVVRYRAGIDAALAPELAVALEAMHERVCSDAPGGVDHEPDRRTIVELMPNHEWFAVRIGGMPSIHTMAASTGPVIAMESPQVGPRFTVGPFDWKRVLQHEYTHTVNLSRTHNRVIHWMTEANAVFNEDAPRGMSTWRQLAQAFASGRLFDLEAINIAFVRPEEPGDRGLAYAQGAWMFEFLVEAWGAEKPREIMDLSAAGRSGPRAFEEALGMTQDEFLERFTAWAREELVEQGLALAPGVPGARALLFAAMDDPRQRPDAGVLDALLAEHPDHPYLLEMRVELALEGAGERLTDEQIALLERLMDARPADDGPHRRLARHHLAGETFADRARAVPHLEFLDEREINSPAYAAELADLYAKLGEHGRAQAKADRAATIAPFDAGQREEAARMALLAGDRAAAERHLTALTIIEPDREVHRRRLEALGGAAAGAP